jgi:membrane protease YdiL (CAAX protease family)
MDKGENINFFRTNSSIIEASLCSLSLMLFSLFVQFEIPYNLVSFAALLSAAYLISKNLNSLNDLGKITGEIPSLKLFILFSAIGIGGGIILAIMYRWHLNAPLVPQSFHWFALIAALIGCTEELVFRGYLQDSVKDKGTAFSILFSTLSHTGYKCCLFLSPLVLIKTNIAFLAFWTFIAGMIYGIIRHYSKSIIPSLVGHALFDVWVYSEFIRAPWWVW